MVVLARWSLSQVLLYILLDKDTLKDFIKYKTDTVISDIVGKKLTDHKMISIVLTIKGMVKGPGHWKLNNSLLNDQTYKNMIHRLIDDIISEVEHRNPGMKWEILKRRIKDESIRYS